MYTLTVLETRSLKSRRGCILVPSECSQEGSAPGLSTGSLQFAGYLWCPFETEQQPMILVPHVLCLPSVCIK